MLIKNSKAQLIDAASSSGPFADAAKTIIEESK